MELIVLTVLGILLISIGINFIIDGYKLNKYRDLSRCRNKNISIEKIKDKDGYIKLQYKWNYLSGIAQILMGLTFIIDNYFVQLEFLFYIIFFVYLIGMFIAIYHSF